MHAVAVPVGEDLDLDVPRPLEILLEQHAVVAEGRRGLALAGRERGGELGGRGDDAHPLAAAARRRLDEDRVSNAIGRLLQERRILVVAVVARDERYAGLFHDGLRGALRAHRADRRGGRADEDDTRALAGRGEILVLRQKSVARVDRLRARAPRDLEDARPAQIALFRGRRADQVSLVGGEHVLRARVGFGVDGDGPDAEPSRGTDHAAGDLAAVGDEDLGEHQFTASNADHGGPSSSSLPLRSLRPR